jgi:hypothetical protein
MMDAEDDDDYNNDRNADGVVFDPQSDLNDSGEEAGGGDDGVQIRTPTPTGDPNCPPSVREAKTISRLIVEKTDGTTGDEYEIFSPDDDGDNGDEDDDEDDNGNNEGNEEEAAGEDRAGNVGDVEDAEDESRTAGRRRGPTPVTNRRKRNRDSDEGEPTFNDIMLMIANQQASEQRDRQEQRIAEREERERRYEEL